MIPNYSDPIVTLNQVYKASEEGSQPVLGACIIGPHYIVRKYEDFSDAQGISYTGAAIAARSYPAHKDTQPGIDSNAVQVLVKDAQLQYASYTTGYTFSFADAARRRLTISSDSGSAVLFQDSLANTVDVIAGDKVKLTVGGTAKEYTVRGLEKDAKNTFTRCVLSESIPAGTISAVVFYRKADCYMKATSFTPTQTTIAIDASAKSKPINIGGTSDSYTIASGKLYVEYRYRSNRFVDKYSMVSGVDYVQDMLGKICPENPLGIAVANAVEEAAGNFVYFIAIDGDTSDSDELVELYTEAADKIADKDNIYGLVPCTDNKRVILALLQFIEKQSAEQIPYFKYLYASKELTSDSTNAEIVESLVDWKQGSTDNKPIKNKRCSIVIADDPIYNSTMHVKNYCVAAALAGKRSGTYPHAPLSNVTLKAITCGESHGFTSSQSKKLGSAGFWRVGMREDGECISRRQLTSAATGDVNYDEQSIVCNIDSIGLSLKVTGRDLVGNTNISPVLINILEAQLNNKLDQYKKYVNNLIGPQLLQGSIISIRQDAIYKDRIYAELDGQPPKPFNRFHITFYMK